MQPDVEMRKVQGIVGDASFSVILPKQFAIDLGIGRGDYVAVKKQGDSIVITKA